MTSRSFAFFAAASALALLGALSPITPAHAAEFTDLLDAADDFDDLDETTWDPFDFNIEPRFTYKMSSGKISREAPCVAKTPYADTADEDLSQAERDIKNNPRLVIDDERCPDTGERNQRGAIVYNKEMDYKHTRAQLDIALRAGIYKDLELRLNVPYVFTSTRTLSFDASDPNAANQVTAANSSVAPPETCGNEAGRCVEREAARVFSPNDTPEQQIDKLDRFGAYRYFELEDAETITRSGFADPTIGLEWALFNDLRDPSKAYMSIGVDYTMPIAPIQARGNNAVGMGMHQLDFSLKSSKQFKWIEPYFGIEYTLPIASPNSPIRKVDAKNNGQVFVNPPMKGQVSVGTEFIPYEDIETGQRYGIDLRFTFGYVSEGRDYNPTFDHFTNSDCNGKTLEDVLPEFDNASGELLNPGDVACAWIVREPSNAGVNPVYDLNAGVQDADTLSQEFNSNGIMTVEGYATFRGDIGLYIQPTHNFQLKAQVALENQQEHFLTNSRTGRDADDASEQTADQTVDLEGPDAAIERNPVYNPSFDSAGERFRVQALNTWEFMLTTAIQF